MHDSHRFCIAPMLHCTDRHYRYLVRLLTKKSMLYTEMITSSAIIHGNRDRFLALDPCEHPVALQLGGSDPTDMAICAQYATEYKYDEVNLNIGCPSNRVQAGKFGACLMLEPTIVADCIKAMRQTTNLDVTVKTRIGVDDQDSYESLYSFIGQIATVGCKCIIVHARKAYLSGLSPRENRTIPPLCYEYVYRLKQDFPQLEIILNGGLSDKTQILKHLHGLDGVMVGREAYENPFFLADIDAMIFYQSNLGISRYDVLDRYKAYMRVQLADGVPLKIMARHLLGLFNGLPGARAWRRYLSEHIYCKDAKLGIIDQAQSLVENIEEIFLAS